MGKTAAKCMFMQTAARDAKEYKQQRYYTQHVVIMWWYNG
jgi:hypothetical protein